MHANTRLHGWFTLAGLALALGGFGCGGSAASQSQARDRATAETCNRYASCEQIGAGKAYATRESCEVDWRAKWESGWPPAECDGKIDQAQLEICLTAIHATDCNAFDVLYTIGTKCPKARICSGGSTPDSGT
jgi:hypothetical protein